MSTENSTPPIKSKSKVKPLQEEILILQDERAELLEEMYENGTRPRPTIMTQIEKKESEALSHIQYCISECEKVTGRKFNLYALCNHLS